MSGKSGPGGRPLKPPSSGRSANTTDRPVTPRKAEAPPDFDNWLDRQLHEMFDKVSAEPLPAELVDLLRAKQGKLPR
jgi:hypothetical protein